MPRYDYKCKKCHRTFEVTHGIDDTVKSCDECGGDVRRVFHPVGIVFKGSGFYATDSKKPDNKPGKSYSDIAEEMDKPSSASSGNDGSEKDKEKAKDDKKPDDSRKAEKTAS